MQLGRMATYWLWDLSVNTEEIEAFSESFADTLEEWRHLHPKQIWENIVHAMLSFGPDLLAALVVFAVGFLITRMVGRLVKKLLNASKIDKTLHYFIRTAVKIALYALVVITCLGILGVPLTPLVTALGVAGLALSLAVQDSLSNLAGGLSVLVNRPFAVGDFVTVGDISGTVRQIRLVYTVIATADNKRVFLTNGDVSKAVITNFSAETTRRLDLTFSIRADSDIPAARRIVERAVEDCAQALPEPAPVVRVNGQSYMLVHIVCQLWVNAPDFFAAQAFLIERVRTDLTAAGYTQGEGGRREA